MKRMLCVVAILVGITVTLACETSPTPVQRGAMGGAAIGALGGQLIGGDTESTLIGAGVGALGGALYNDYKYNK